MDPSFSLSRRRSVKRARSRGGTVLLHRSRLRFLCQAFIPPQVDDPLNLAGVYSFLQRMQPSYLPIRSSSSRPDSDCGWSLASASSPTYRKVRDTRRAAERRNSNVRGGGPREVSKVKDSCFRGRGLHVVPKVQVSKVKTIFRGRGPSVTSKVTGSGFRGRSRTRPGAPAKETTRTPTGTSLQEIGARCAAI